MPPILAVFAVHRGRGDNPELDPPLNFRGDHLWGEQNKSPIISFPFKGAGNFPPLGR